MALTAKSIVEDSIKLYSLPDVYYQVREMIHDPRFSAIEIGQVIAKDPALSIRLLKIVNSSFYGFQARVDTISRAITIIGMNELQDLVLATSVVDTFNMIPGGLIDMTDFWIQSINCAIVAKLLARKSAVLHEERLFIAGLLHDIGALVIYTRFPEQAAKMLGEAGNCRVMLARLEGALIGFTRAEVGGELAHCWGLPGSLSEAIYYQFNPGAALVHRMDAHLLSLAVNLCNTEYDVDQALAAVSANTLPILRLDQNQIEQVMTAADEDFASIFDMLQPGKKFH